MQRIAAGGFIQTEPWDMAIDLWVDSLGAWQYAFSVMNLQRAKKQLYINSLRHIWVAEVLSNTHIQSISSITKRILALDIFCHLSYNSSSNLHERTLEYLAMEYRYLYRSNHKSCLYQDSIMNPLSAPLDCPLSLFASTIIITRRRCNLSGSNNNKSNQEKKGLNEEEDEMGGNEATSWHG